MTSEDLQMIEELIDKKLDNFRNELFNEIDTLERDLRNEMASPDDIPDLEDLENRVSYLEREL